MASSQPPKAKQRRIKIVESKTFETTLKKARTMKNKTCIVEMIKSQSEIRQGENKAITHSLKHRNNK